MSAEEITTRFRVEGMDCASCASKIDTAVRRLPGVDDVSVSVVAGTMTVGHQGADLDQVQKKVSDLGYRVSPLAPGRQSKQPALDHAHSHDHDHDHSETATDALAGMHGHDHGSETGPWWQTGKARLTLSSAVAAITAFALEIVLPGWHTPLFILAMLVGLIPIARRAFQGAINGSPFSIETLMTVAAVGAVFIDAAEEAAIVVLLFLIGELLEGIATGRARASIKALADLVPRRAQREIDGRVNEVDAAELAVGDLVLVRPGDRIPADGVVLSGEGSVDEAPVTGESVPKNKGPEDPVFAGTVNHDGALRIKVTAAAADNTIARIVSLVEEAQESKAPTERFIDRFSRDHTPGVLLAGALIALVPPLVTGASWDEWIYKGLAILLIGCPCALVISTPAAIAAALSAGARQGLLMKGGVVLEQLGKINMVALDKTGTLTEGRPQVTDIMAVGRSEAEILRLAAALEVGSSHPLATAILAKAKAEGVEPIAASNSSALGGKGVLGTLDGVELFLGSPKAAADRASLSEEFLARIGQLNDEGKTVSVLIAGGALAGLIGMRDEPRDDARCGLEALKALGADVVMLTGDNARTARAIGADLGIDVKAELLPEDKQRIVSGLKAEGKVVAKVGDGINDAPALAAADIGIAMGGGTDVALETADAAVLHGRVIDVANLIRISRATMANIGQNITIALGLKAVFLVTTIIGVTGLWPAILADTGATLLVTANALRLLAWKGERG